MSFTHILLPTDGSELSGRVSKACLRFAKSCGARVTAFHAMPDFGAAVVPDVSISTVPRELFQNEARTRTAAYLSAVEAEARAMGVVCVSASALSNAPHRAIIEYAAAHGCDLIFMAPFGRAGDASALLGSETNKVLMHSRTPVLVYY